VNQELESQNRIKLADITLSPDMDKDWKLKRLIAIMKTKKLTYSEIIKETDYTADYVRKNLVPTLESKGLVRKIYAMNRKLYFATNDEVEI